MPLKSWILIALSAGALHCQTQNCNIGPSTFTTTGRAQIANLQNQCAQWTATYYTEGISGVSLELDGAQDNGGAPGSWAAITSNGSCSVTTGSNPSTTTGTSTLVFTNCYYPWISIAVTTFTGTGKVVARVYGQASAARGGGSASLPPAGASTTYYVATTGADTNDCRSAATACLTLGHVLGTAPAGSGFTPGLIPFGVGQNYIINVANGTYNEGIYVGFNTMAQKINIVGNAASPSSVVFNRAVGCDYINDLSASSTPTTMCNVGSNLSISGISLTGVAGDRAAMTYRGGHTAAASVVATCTGLTTSVSYCWETTTTSLLELFSPITLTCSDASNTTGSCLQANAAAYISWYGSSSSGALTISGPGSGVSNIVGLFVNRHSSFDAHLLAGNTGSTMTVSNFGIEILVTSGSDFSDLTSTTNPGITLSNTSGTSGVGVYVEAGFWMVNTGGLQMTNLATGLQTDTNGTIAQKNCSYTNVTTHTSGSAFSPSCF